jgi:hypothetical protein
MSFNFLGPTFFGSFSTFIRASVAHAGTIRDIFHKNREISILTMKKKHSKVNTWRSHRKFQTRKDKTNQKKKKKNKNSSMNNSASLKPVQGPLTVVGMIVTYLSQLPHWLHQLPTVGKGQWKAPTCELSFCCKSGSNRKTQPYYWPATDHNARTW